MVLDGKGRPRRRAAEPRSWTKAKERAFLSALADSCNVKHACAAARVSTTHIYERRKRDAGFRASWDQALASGYAQLELMMLERALHGVEKIVVPRSGNPLVMREYSDRVGLALLRMHRETARIAGETAEPAEVEEAIERIILRLERIGGDGGIETKAARRVTGLTRTRRLNGPR